jgi:hypothetical protein
MLLTRCFHRKGSNIVKVAKDTEALEEAERITAEPLVAFP